MLQTSPQNYWVGCLPWEAYVLEKTRPPRVGQDMGA